MATKEEVEASAHKIVETYGALFRKACQIEADSKGLETFYNKMSQEEIDAWAEFDQRWVEDEGFRDAYVGLLTLENL